MEAQDQTGKEKGFWKRGIVMCAAVAFLTLLPSSAAAQTRLIVRDSLGLPGINLTCALLGCNVVDAIGDPQGQLFVVSFPSLLNPLTAILELKLELGIVDVEIDQTVKTLDATAGPAPSYLTDETPTSYYGATVWHGYVVQPSTQLIRLAQTQSTFHTAGAGVIVAVIDTGVDPTNPVLQNLLVDGYDFTRNTSGGSELSDVSASPDYSDVQAAQVNQRTVAVLDQRTVAVLDGSQYSAFGHGTMTAGIVHLVAPQARIMPLKSFTAAGTGYDSDVLRAIYYAVKNGARVLSMSFDYTTYSQELATAIKYANGHGLVSVASAGNDGQQIMVYPGGLPGVIDVASTSNQDTQSVFTNYGAPPVWLAAPGEGVVTTYPWGLYAAGWGTSFSAPFASGTVALMLGQNGGCSSSAVANGLAHADSISDPQLGHGRLDAYTAVQSCRY